MENKQPIVFTVYGEPVAQGRPKATTVGGFVRMYDPKKSKDFKDFVKLVASEHAPAALLEGQLKMKVDVFRTIPKSLSKKKAAQAEAGEIRPTSKPDVDNYLKGIKDALKSVIWKDDSQVVEVLVSKWYSERPRVEVQIAEI
ncbi:RusA family crossover junction endodeoxyribonuclease [Brevibacillus sp. AG]|uniref:RusA family crossover junction endodeoxyribonuclease n=1 Tax=Brevibacillus sp. AG TaxID=3020891 RepID=UPI002330EFFD|nr:RusA family crossover junction endodeoxyribonuclease [Brevibacillus sp. AG]MDC0763449.1 RusA family crossover junction endodeoxyribonuclease [Brevibacillus sp. AG]